MNGLKFLVLGKNKCYRYISCVTFSSVRNFESFFIYQFDELDLLKTTKNEIHEITTMVHSL